MGKVVVGMTMSLDGFVNDENGSVERLYPDLPDLRDSKLMQDAMHATGAVMMGLHSYEMGQGDYTGYEYQVPIFVVTHHPPEKVAKGENGTLKFTFVTDGLESAVKQAKAAAGEKDVTVVGGVSLIQQLLKQRLVDELQIGIMPVLFGTGLRLFENLEVEQIDLELTSVIQTPPRTDLFFRVVK